MVRFVWAVICFLIGVLGGAAYDACRHHTRRNTSEGDPS